MGTEKFVGGFVWFSNGNYWSSFLVSLRGNYRAISALGCAWMTKEDSRALRIFSLTFVMWIGIAFMVEQFRYSEWSEVIWLLAGIAGLLCIFPAMALSFLIWPKD